MSSLNADHLLTGGRIYTEVSPPTSVPGLAIRDGRVLGPGTTTELEPLIGPSTEVLNLEGRAVLPGLTDAHLHLEQYARSLQRVNCDTKDLDECLKRIASRVDGEPEGTWIEGHGWDQNRWGRWPTAKALDRVSPSHPVYLTARSLHAAAANSAALRAAGIGIDARDPQDGALQRADDGSLTGVLFEGAMELVSRAIPSPGDAELAGMIEEAQESLWRLGLTGVHDFDGRSCFAALQHLRTQGRLGLRILKHLRLEQLDGALAAGLRSGFGDAMLRLGNVKIFADGALGPRTAAMLSPYDDEPENRGMLLLDEEQLLEISLRAARGGWPMTIHAIGDRANHQVLNALRALREISTREDIPWRRHRIEHVQVLHPDDVHRLAELQAFASMQPIHATSDRAMADAGWGERVRHAYAWRELQESGAVLVFGSDAPVESANPFWGLHAAVNRTAPDAKHGGSPWTPEQCIDFESALAAYTVGPALASGRHDRLGHLMPGAYADLVVLGEDPFESAPEALASMLPAATMVNGDWHFRSF